MTCIKKAISVLERMVEPPEGPPITYNDETKENLETLGYVIRVLKKLDNIVNSKN